MSTVTYVPTKELRSGDLILVDGSTIEVCSVELAVGDAGAYQVTTCCVSGNMDQWDDVTHRWEPDTEWVVLNFTRQGEATVDTPYVQMRMGDVDWFAEAVEDAIDAAARRYGVDAADVRDALEGRIPSARTPRESIERVASDLAEEAR
jgi:hypothetical protein